MSKKATAQTGKSEKKVNQAAVEKFLKEHQGKLVIDKKKADEPVTYVIAGVHEKQTMGLRDDLGGGPFSMILLKKQGDDAAEPVAFNPNMVMDLVNGKEVTGFELGEGKAVETTTTTEAKDATDTTQQAGAAELTDEQKAKAAADAKAADDRKAVAAAKKEAKEAAKKKREDERQAKVAKDNAEKLAREAKKAQKAKSSVKIKALRIYRGEPMTVPDGTTHRSRVMAKFRAPESQGGLEISTQHANTYYQNCKGLWADDKLPEDADQGGTAAQ